MASEGQPSLPSNAIRRYVPQNTLNANNSVQMVADVLFRKLVVVGDGACGKTSLLSVFTLGYFPTVYLYPEDIN